jgi:ATP-dependent DNA ligase
MVTPQSPLVPLLCGETRHKALCRRQVQPSQRTCATRRDDNLKYMAMPTQVGHTASFIEPMLAVPVRHLPTVGNWIYEAKFDGYTGPFAFKTGKGVRLVSRNRKSFNHDYRRLIDGLKSSTAKDFIIDGEIVALDAQERPSFQLLQGYAKDPQKGVRNEVSNVIPEPGVFEAQGTISGISSSCGSSIDSMRHHMSCIEISPPPAPALLGRVCKSSRSGEE